MSLPHYQSTTHVMPDMQRCNMGLRFERFFDEYDSNWAVKDDAKTTFLSKFTKACGDDTLLNNANQKQLSLTHALGGAAKAYQLDWHMVTGMGNSHPVENGFLWHYTLGVPYVSGSQLKGMVRAVIELYMPEGEDKNELLFKWFGSASKDSEDTQAGELIFFDALPIAKPVLTVDIMTPHMKNWYAKGGDITSVSAASDDIPADWHDPTPIPFLAVKQATFLFSIAPRANSDVDIDQVFDCLNKALEYMGIGAKTQTGYGYMTLDEKQQKKIQEQSKEIKDGLDNLGKPSEVIRIDDFIKELASSKKNWKGKPQEAMPEFDDFYNDVMAWDETNEYAQEALDTLLEYGKIWRGKKLREDRRKWRPRIQELKNKFNLA